MNKIIHASHRIDRAKSTGSRMQLIEDIRERLSKNNFQHISYNAFSQQYLNRSRSYLSVTKHNNVQISDSALLSLYRNLCGMRDIWRDISNSSPEEFLRPRQNVVLYEQLAELILKEIESTNF